MICHKVEVKSTHDKSGPCFNTCREDPWGKTSPTELDPNPPWIIPRHYVSFSR